MIQLTFRTTLQVTRVQDLKTKPWSGGTTTELLKLPESSSLEGRNFACRVSTATVAQDSDFSKFAGYTRILALVSGSGMRLSIDGHPHLLTQRFQQLRFSGDAPVNAQLLDGPVSDFNVIFGPNVEAALKSVSLGPIFKAIQPPELKPQTEYRYLREDILWAPEGGFEVEYGREKVSIGPRDVFRIRHDSRPVSLQARSNGDACEALMVSLRLPESFARG